MSINSFLEYSKSFEIRILNDFLDELKNIKEEKIVYMFSETETLDQTIFKGIKNCNPRPIPQKILNIYHDIFNENVDFS